MSRISKLQAYQSAFNGSVRWRLPHIVTWWSSPVINSSATITACWWTFSHANGFRESILLEMMKFHSLETWRCNIPNWINSLLTHQIITKPQHFSIKINQNSSLSRSSAHRGYWIAPRRGLFFSGTAEILFYNVFFRGQNGILKYRSALRLIIRNWKTYAALGAIDFHK